jgi:hypothetical protein
MLRLNYTIYLILIFAIIFYSCKKEEIPPADDVATAPSTYNFTNVAHTGQTVKLLMLEAMEAKMALATTTVFASGELKKYFDSTNTYFGIEPTLSSKSLKQDFLASNALLKAQWTDSIYSWIDSIEQRNIDGKPNPLIREDSLHLSQAIAKTIMGGLFFDQAVNKYLVNLLAADNTTVTAGKGTDMEHQFDEAFGYFGAAKDYNNYSDADKVISSFYIDSDGNGSQNVSSEKIFKYYAATAAKRDNANLGTDYTKSLFDAFLKGRFAISNNNYADRDAAIAVIKNDWEAIIAATVLHYINDTKADADGSVNRSTHWSEMKFYFNTLQFYPGNKLTTMGVFNTVDGLLGKNPKETDDDKLDQAAGIIAGLYGFSVDQKNNWRLKY